MNIFFKISVAMTIFFSGSYSLAGNNTDYFVNPPELLSAGLDTNDLESGEWQKFEILSDEDESQNPAEEGEGVFNVPQSFIQYTSNSVSNSGVEPIEIYDSEGKLIETVPPQESRTFVLQGQSSLTFKRGTSTSKTVNVKPNEKPKIIMQRLAAAGESQTVRNLQSVVGYRIQVFDDFPSQLEVTIGGPVVVQQVAPNVYDVKLKRFGSKQEFEKFSENRDSPYEIKFTVTVKDKIALQHIVNQIGVYQFGEW